MGPNNKDYSIWGVYIRVPLFRETTICQDAAAAAAAGAVSG